MPTPTLRPLLAILISLVAAGVTGRTTVAQESTSAPLAAELSRIMTEQQLGAAANKDTLYDDRFVAVLAFPGQLLVVSAQYAAPLIIQQKITDGQFREAYIDLNAASIAGTKIQITDAGANSCALEFSWTLDCERVLAGGVSR